MATRARRPTWAALPTGLRAEVETLLGSAVERAASMPGGWSPGSADRLVLADGRRAFAKAVDARVNAVTDRLHRREAAVLAALTGAGVAPDLLGTAEDGHWFAVVVEDVGGRHPDPRDERDTRAVLDAVRRLPDPVPSAVPPADEDLLEALDDCAAGWARLLESGAETVPGGRPVVVELAARSAGAGAAGAGRGLVHGDLRVDNVLVDRSGRATLIDWPSAGAGRSWFDGLTYLLDARRLAGLRGPLLVDHPLLAGVAREDVDAVVAALAGYFFDSARRSPQPGMDGLREFQREQGLVLLDVLLPSARQPGQRY